MVEQFSRLSSRSLVEFGLDDHIEGRRPVRIAIRHADGHTIGSDTLWTEVSTRSGGDTLRRRMGTLETPPEDGKIRH